MRTRTRVIGRARARVRASSPFTYALSYLAPRDRRHLFWVWYSYFRSIDDEVDEGGLSQGESLAIIQRHQLALADLYAAPEVSIVGSELGLLTLADRRLSGGLRPHLEGMLAAMEFDVRNVGRTVSYQELRAQYRQEVFCYLGALAFFCGMSCETSLLAGKSAALGAKTAHILRDFLKDYNRSQINISSEELNAFGLTPEVMSGTPRASAVRSWVASQVRNAEALICTGLGEAAEASSLRYRFMVAILAAKYQSLLQGVRERGFVLAMGKQSSSFRFLSNSARNIFAMLGFVRTGNRNGTRRKINRIVANRFSHLTLCIKLFSPSVLRARISLRSVLTLSRTTGQSPKLKNRFATAYLLGRYCADELDPAASRRRLHRAGLVYAFWAASVLELDARLDAAAEQDSGAARLALGWPASFGSHWSESIPALQNSAFGEATITRDSLLPFLMAELSRRVRTFHRTHDGTSVHAADRTAMFRWEATEFIRAQLGSGQQSAYTQSRDWRWYRDELLDKKTLGFFLAPLPLFCCNGDLTALDRLRIDFLTLNAAYFHWQLLDDVADLSADCQAGLLTAPAYILLSQGHLADLWLNGTKHATLVAAVQSSGLIAPAFLYSSLFDSVRHLTAISSDSDQLVHFGLINVREDAETDLRAICEQRRSCARDLVECWSTRRFADAEHAIRRSGAPSRIVLAACEEGTRAAAADDLSVESSAALALVELLISRALAKASAVL